MISLRGIKIFYKYKLKTPRPRLPAPVNNHLSYCFKNTLYNIYRDPGGFEPPTSQTSNKFERSSFFRAYGSIQSGN